jgi:galactokinase
LTQKQALADGDFDTFLRLVRESGESSWRLLQNVIPKAQTKHQEVALALALAEKLLKGEGACRVHGGGFAGTIQAFVPMDRLDAFKTGMEAVLGAGKCHVLSIVPNGGMLESETEE